MEFSGMIFVNEKLFRNTERLKDLIYHEILHQWFYGILGVDQLNEPFLDEGLVTFFTYYLSNTLDKNCAFDSNLFNMKLCDYANKSMYLQLAYANSSNYINSLYQKYGHDKFFKKIKKIFEERAFSIISYEDFKSYFE
jgi:aminopeptidase N